MLILLFLVFTIFNLEALFLVNRTGETVKIGVRFKYSESRYSFNLRNNDRLEIKDELETAFFENCHFKLNPNRSYILLKPHECIYPVPIDSIKR